MRTDLLYFLTICSDIILQLWLDDINWLSFRNDYDNFHDKTSK